MTNLKIILAAYTTRFNKRVNMDYEFIIKNIRQCQIRTNPKRKKFKYLVKILPEGTIFKFFLEEDQLKFQKIISQVKKGIILGKSDYQSDLLVVKFKLL